MRVGILGYGSVGKAVGQLSRVFSIAVYDPNIAAHSSAAKKAEALTADVVFCCVPTNANADGSLNTRIVEALKRCVVQQQRPVCNKVYRYTRHDAALGHTLQRKSTPDVPRIFVTAHG